jgi:phosphoglycerate dehydrogenase-like enzyme
MSEDKINVVVAMDFSDALIEQIRAVSPRLNVQQFFPDVPQSAWGTAEVLYTTRTFPQPEETPLLRWIQLHSAGMERALQHRIIQAQDITVTSSSGIHSTQIANFCLMMMLAFNYKLPQMLNFQRESTWAQKAHEIFRPTDMSQQTVGIVGYGSIGRELARITHTLGMTVLASKRDVKHPAEKATDYTLEGTGDPEGSIPERIYPGEAIGTMASECDYLAVTVPLTTKTQHLVNEHVLQQMKKTAVLINIARGSVVDEKALITALSQKKIGGAALDVFEEEPLPSTSPLWQMDNVIISPHVSGMTDNYHEKAAALFIANLKRYLEKKPLYNQLDREIGY